MHKKLTTKIEPVSKKLQQHHIKNNSEKLEPSEA